MRQIDAPDLRRSSWSATQTAALCAKPYRRIPEARLNSENDSVPFAGSLSHRLAVERCTIFFSGNDWLPRFFATHRNRYDFCISDISKFRTTWQPYYGSCCCLGARVQLLKWSRDLGFRRRWIWIFTVLIGCDAVQFGRHALRILLPLSDVTPFCLVDICYEYYWVYRMWRRSHW
jgi:hypothetical protein